MRICFYANMRTLVGQEEMEVNNLKGGNTLRNLLSYLTHQFPDIRLHLFDSAGNLRQDVPIFVDGRNPRLSGQGLDVRLDSDAVISFFSPISSGRMNVAVLSSPDSGIQEQNDEG
jgi:molybdopterin converting factor small subunit